MSKPREEASRIIDGYTTGPGSCAIVQAKRVIKLLSELQRIESDFRKHVGEDSKEAERIRKAIKEAEEV